MIFQKTPLRQLKLVDKDINIWLKDESFNPTGTFKDRLAWSLTRQLLNDNSRKELLVSCITMGNTVKSIGYYFSEYFEKDNRPQVLGLFPLGFSERIIGPDSSGKKITGKDLIQFCEKVSVRCFEVDLETQYLTEQEINSIAKRFGLEFTSHRDVSYGIGEDAYSVILEESLNDMIDPPTRVYVPVGAGVLFDECVKVVEERGLDCTVVGVSVLKKESIADKIYGYYSPYFKALVEHDIAYHALFPKHPVIHVSDEKIRDAIKMISSLGINAEPSAAAAFVPLFTNTFIEKGTVLVINSGNGMRI